MSIPHLLFLVIMGLYTLIYVSKNISDKNGVDIYTIYFLLLLLIVPIWSMFRSNNVFDQPYYYGFLSERSWLVVCAGVVLYQNIIHRPEMLKIIKNVFIKLSFFTLFVYSFIYLFFDLSQFDDYKFVTENDLRGYRLKLNIFFINFGLLYSFIKLYNKRSIYNFLLFTIFFLYIIFVVQGRAHLLQILLTCFLFLIFRQSNFSLSKKTYNLTLYSFVSAIFLSSIFFLNPEFISNFVFSISQLFSVVGGDISYDSSANSRIVQAIIALDVISDSSTNLWFGVGKISSQWGYNSYGMSYFFGHFYPSDIGILGGLFQYGIFGILLLWLIPILMCISIIKKIPTNKNNDFIVALKFLLIFYIFGSINTGNFFFLIQEYILIFYILFAYQNIKNLNHNNVQLSNG